MAQTTFGANSVIVSPYRECQIVSRWAKSRLFWGNAGLEACPLMVFYRNYWPSLNVGFDLPLLQ